MACRIDFRITFFYPDTYTRWVGTATHYAQQPPAVGTNIGPDVALVVRQVHYLGTVDGTDKDHYLVRLMTLSWGHGHDIRRTILERTPWLRWEFAEELDNESEVAPNTQ